MSGRCKSCDSVLSDEDMCYKDYKTGEYTELCYKCRQVDYEEDLPFNAGSGIELEYGYSDD